MKKFFIIACFALTGSLVILNSCKQADQPTGLTVPEYSFSSLDTNGGNWKPLLLTSNSQIAVAAPDSVTINDKQNKKAPRTDKPFLLYIFLMSNEYVRNKEYKILSYC